MDDYLAEAGVNESVERYSAHGATLSAHLSRHRVSRRRPELGVGEAAESVKLYPGSASMPTIAQSTGVDRKAIRRALVEASSTSA